MCICCYLCKSVFFLFMCLLNWLLSLNWKNGKNNIWIISLKLWLSKGKMELVVRGVYLYMICFHVFAQAIIKIKWKKPKLDLNYLSLALVIRGESGVGSGVHFYMTRPRAGLRPAGPRWIVGRVQFARVYFSRLASRLRRSARRGQVLWIQRKWVPTGALLDGNPWLMECQPGPSLMENRD